MNEAARLELGMENTMNKKVLSWFFGNETGAVIGVVNDFHNQPFNNSITPIVFVLYSSAGAEQNMVVKLNDRDYRKSIALISKRWKESGIEAPFIYSFMNEWFADLIRKEIRRQS
jgi:putative ABC transport system permease protein